MIFTPKDYAEFSLLARVAGKEMLSRLDWVKRDLSLIVDVGCGTGDLTALLAQRYPYAQLFAFDSVPLMLQQAKQYSKPHWICADAVQLPLAHHSVDLIYSNFLLPWANQHELLFREWKRLLAPNGLVSFSSLGPNSFSEWREVMSPNTFLNLVDMHDVGDAVIHAGLLDPILDVDYYTFSYQNAETFWRELGACDILPYNQEFYERYQAIVSERAAQGKLEVTFEVVYGHAWAPGLTNQFRADEQGVVSIPVSQLRTR